MREFMKECRIPAQESEDGDGEAERLLPLGDRLGGQEPGGGPLDGVLEEAGGLEVGLGVDHVVEAPVLDPLEADLGYGPALVVLVVVVEERSAQRGEEAAGLGPEAHPPQNRFSEMQTVGRSLELGTEESTLVRTNGEPERREPTEEHCRSSGPPPVSGGGCSD